MSEKPKKHSKFFLVLKSIRDFFIAIETNKQPPDLLRDYEEGSYMDTLTKQLDIGAALGAKRGVAEDIHRLNLERIELARLDQEREITNNNLKAQHRTLIITTLATFIALFSSVSAIFIASQKETPPAPIVNVKPAQQAPPDVNVYVQPEKPPVETPVQ